MPVIGIAEVLVQPSFVGLQEKVGREVRRAMPKAGQDAGQQLGKGMSEGFAEGAEGVRKDMRKVGNESDRTGQRVGRLGAALNSAFRGNPLSTLVSGMGASTDALKKYEFAVEAASANIAKAKRREEDALAAVRIAQIRLTEARKQGEDGSTSVIAAQERLAAAHRRVESAQESTTRSTRNLEVAEDRLAAAIRKNAGGIGAEFNKMSSVGSRAGRNVLIATSGISAGLAAVTPAAGAAGSGMLAASGTALTFASSLGQLAGVAALVPAGLMSIGAGAGVLVTAFSGVGEALKTAVEQTGKSVGSAQLDAMALADAARGVTRAEENAAESVAQASRRVEDAKRNLADVVERNAEQQAAAVRRVVDAEREVERANRRVTESQQELNTARAEAIERVEDLSRSLERAGLSEREAALRYEEAASAYREGVESGADTSSRGMRRLKLDLDQASLGLKTAKEDAEELRKEQAQASKEGVEGNKQVIRAEQSLTDAREAAAEAVQAREDAVREVVKVERESARAVVEAQASIADATASAAMAQRDAAESVADAHRSLARVQLQQAKAASASVEAMDNLTPSAQEAVRALLQVKDQLGGIRRIAQENFFRGFAAPLMTLAGSVMPQLATGVGAIASAMGAGAQMFMGSLERALGGGVLESLLMGVAKSTEILNKGIDPVVQSFTTLGVVGMKYMPRLAQFITDAADRFDRFIQTAAADGSLDRWIEDGIQGFKDLWSIAGSVSGIFEALTRAAESAGIVSTLGGMAVALRNVEAVMQGPVFQTTMTTIFAGAEKGAAGLLAALGPIGDAFVRGAPAMAEFLRLGGLIAGTFLGGVFTALSDPAFGAGLVTFMEGLETGVNATAPHLPGMAAAFGSLLASLAPIAEVIGPALVQVLTGFAQGLSGVIDFLSPLLVLIAGSPVAMGILIGAFGLAVVAAGLFTAAMAIQRVIVIGAWALMSAQALLHGGRMALAWVIALGPIAWVTAAVLGLAALIILNWDKISVATRVMWETHVKPHLDTFHKFINETLPAAFKFGVGLIEEHWNKLKKIASDPVAFVINTVIRDGLIGGLNTIAKALQMDEITPPPEFKGFARGGVLPGQSSWRDGDDQLVPMRRGEGVYVSEVMRDPFERARLFAMNRAAVMGQSIAQVRNMFGEGLAKGGLVHPLRASTVSQPFHGGHNGIDFAAPTGTPIVAAGPGRVSMAGWSTGGGGNEVHIDHPNGLQTWYAHLSSFAVKAGDMVRNAGQIIGKVGSTGNSTGPHLHYMVLNGGWPNYTNPAAYLDGGGEAGSKGGGWNPIAAITDGLVNSFKAAFPAAGFIADLAIGAGKKLLDGAAGFVMGNGGKDNIGSTSLPYLHDNGGVLNPGLSLILNRTRKPEAIYNHEQNRALQTLAARGAEGGMFPDTVRLLVDGHEFTAYVDRRAGSVVQSYDSNSRYARVGR
jgi:hypothetical protein